MTRLGIIAGLASEIRCLSPWRGNLDIDIGCAGADSGRATRLAEKMAENGCRGLVSFGIAGGLDSALSTGDLVLPKNVVSGEHSWSCAEDWRQILHRQLASGMNIHGGSVAGSPGAVATAAGKAEQHRISGAVATDMESHAVAAVADRLKLPFVVVRVVADPWDQGIPAWMLGLIAEDGHVRPLRTLASLLAHPGDWPEVDRLRRQNRLALNVLGRVATLAGPFFGFTEFGG